MASPSAAFSVLTELRSRHCNLTVFPSDTTRARLLEVCTSPGMAIDIFCTPSGQPTTAFVSFSATSRATISAGASHSLILTDTASSMPAYSALTTFSYAFSSLANASYSFVLTITTASASRGMALRRPPPSTEHSNTSCDAEAAFRKRNSTLLALARWHPIWMPEWPPLSPLTVIFAAV